MNVLFHQPTKMDKIVYTDLLSIFREYLKKKSIVFSLKQIIGPQYTELKIYHRKNESPQEASRGEKYIHNIDRRLISRIPVFFGIKYTSGKKIKDKKGWTPSKNPDSIMQEHKKLYDILYSCCHQACDIDNKQSKMFSAIFLNRLYLDLTGTSKVIIGTLSIIYKEN